MMSPVGLWSLCVILTAAMLGGLEPEVNILVQEGE